MRKISHAGISYVGYRFPPEIIQQAIWLYLRFTLSYRDVEDLLAERGILVSYETVRRWVNHFGPMVAAQLASADQSRTRLGILTKFT
jgi:putative transposase